MVARAVRVALTLAAAAIAVLGALRAVRPVHQLPAATDDEQIGAC